MPALPDPTQLDAIATLIGAHADTIRAEAARLAATLGAGGWRGAAADAFHAQARTVLAILLVSATRLDIAADALRRHAATVARIGAEERAAAASVRRSHHALRPRDLLHGVA